MECGADFILRAPEAPRANCAFLRASDNHCTWQGDIACSPLKITQIFVVGLRSTTQNLPRSPHSRLTASPLYCAFFSEIYQPISRKSEKSPGKISSRSSTLWDCRLPTPATASTNLFTWKRRTGERKSLPSLASVSVPFASGSSLRCPLARSGCKRRNRSGCIRCYCPSSTPTHGRSRLTSARAARWKGLCR